MSQGSVKTKIRFLGQKVCSVARGQTDRQKLLVLYKEKNLKMPIKCVKMKISKKKCVFPKIRFLGQKVCPVARGQTDRRKNLLVLYKGKNRKMPIKSVKMKISKNKKMRFFLMSQGSFNPKIRFLGQKVCPVARPQTHRHTDTHTDTHYSPVAYIPSLIDSRVFDNVLSNFGVS